MYTNTCMFCVVYSSIQKFTIITILKTAIFITIIFVISILSNYLNYRTALSAEKNQILHFENVNKREVGLHSPNMEGEGMIRCLDFLIAKGMKVAELITDSSTSVAKTLSMFIIHRYIDTCFNCLQNTETKYPSVYHSRDVWHKAKKLKKALAEV